MKKLVFVAAVLMMLATGWQAAGASTPITIEGTVTDSGVPVAGKKVGIDCFGKLFANFIGFAVSDGGGQYVMHTDSSLCPVGQQVMVRGDKDGDGVFESAAVGVVAPVTIVNLQLGKNFAVPEFGLPMSVVAMGIGATLFWRARRRALREEAK